MLPIIHFGGYNWVISEDWNFKAVLIGAAFCILQLVVCCNIPILSHKESEVMLWKKVINERFLSGAKIWIVKLQTLMFYNIIYLSLLISDSHVSSGYWYEFNTSFIHWLYWLLWIYQSLATLTISFHLFIAICNHPVGLVSTTWPGYYSHLVFVMLH